MQSPLHIPNQLAGSFSFITEGQTAQDGQGSDDAEEQATGDETERRTAVDFAHQMRWLVDEAYPHTETIRLVLDNLNTHKLGSLYDAFEPVEARRIAKGLEFHYTPVHGSWLNMAEIELSVLSNQYINRRISDEAVLKREVLALERERNEAVAVIDWRFSTQHARTKLQHIYPPYSD